MAAESSLANKVRGCLWDIAQLLICAKRRTLLNPMVIFAAFLIVSISFVSLLSLEVLGDRSTFKGVTKKIVMVIIGLFPLPIFYFLISSVYIKPDVNDKIFKEFLEKNPSVKKNLRFCAKCRKYKPYRASHCSFCNTCVIRRDHHCPWINNCVSFFNHREFIFFLVVTTIGLLVNIIITFINYKDLSSLQKSSRKSKDIFIFMSFLSGTFAFSLVLVIPLILGQQITAVVKNFSACEEYDLDRINSFLHRQNKPSIKNPYDIDWKTNVYQILNASSHDGIVFPTIKGYSNNFYAKCGRNIDDTNCEIVSHYPYCTVTTESYGASFWVPGHFLTTLLNPLLFNNVLSCSKGEVVYLSKKKLNPFWTKCYQIIDYDTGSTIVEGYMPSCFLKSPVEN